MKSFAPFSIDTRTLQKGDLFIALDGKNQKGCAYIEDALSKGASRVICSKIYLSTNSKYFFGTNDLFW